MTNGVLRYKLIPAQLDESQWTFCTDEGRALRLLAPAGSGKTHSLLWRCLTLSGQAGEGTSPRFLVFTFTRAARDELRDRLKANPEFAPIAPNVEVTTLNAWGFRRLRGRLHNPRLVTSTTDRYFTMMNLLQPVWRSHPQVSDVLTDGRRRTRAARALMDLMDHLKSLGFRHDQHTDFEAFQNHVLWLYDNGMQAHVEGLHVQLEGLEIIGRRVSSALELEQIYEGFFVFWRDACEHMFQSAVITLEDQKYWTLIEMEQAVRERRFTTGMHRYTHILVDEFQDINLLGLNLLKAIAAANRTKLTIIGDDDQAIYEWRGATPEFILRPDDHIEPGYRTYTLEVNYRSPRNIVELSQKLIRHNQRRVEKSVRSAWHTDAVVEVLGMPRLEESVQYVKAEVIRLLGDQNGGNVAIISRKRSQIIPYQIIFASNEIPFCAAEDLHVMLSKAFENLKEMLAIKANADRRPPFGPDPIEAMLKICDLVKRYPLSKRDRARLKTHLVQAKPRSLYDACIALYDYRGPLKGRRNQDGEMSFRFFEAIHEFLGAGSIADTIRAISDSFEGLQRDYGKSLDDIFYADPPFLYLSEYAERYGHDYEAFYEDIDKASKTLVQIATDDEEELAFPDGLWKQPLHLMTALRAKGKEFDTVIILDCNDGIWPSKLAKEDWELEAERRLFYVGLTRARRRVVMLVNDRMLGEVCLPSPYIAEMGLSVQPYASR